MTNQEAFEKAKALIARIKAAIITRREAPDALDKRTADDEILGSRWQLTDLTPQLLAEIERLQARETYLAQAIKQIGDLADVDADERGWMAKHAIEGRLEIKVGE